jgi:ribonuclease P protein component
VAKQTFRRSDRLPEKDFVRAVRGPALVRTGHLRIHARRNGLGGSRLGISVGRRFGKAVMRNRLKRLVREAFRAAPEVRAAGLDIVVVATDAGVLDRRDGIAEAFALAAERTRSPERKGKSQDEGS